MFMTTYWVSMTPRDTQIYTQIKSRQNRLEYFFIVFSLIPAVLALVTWQGTVSSFLVLGASRAVIESAALSTNLASKDGSFRRSREVSNITLFLGKISRTVSHFQNSCMKVVDWRKIGRTLSCVTDQVSKSGLRASTCTFTRPLK